MSEFRSNVVLECDGEGWFGSFGLAVTTFIEDILSDGAPFSARVTWGEPTETEIVTILRVVDGVVIAHGRDDRTCEIALCDITKLEA